MRSTHPRAFFYKGRLFFKRSEKMRVWKIENEIILYSTILNTTPIELENALKIENKDYYYGNTIQIPKKNGKRIICCVDKENILYSLQKKLTQNFLSNIMLSDCVYGFVEGYNYFDFLNEHTDFWGNKYFLRLDIKSFFDSIDQAQVKKVLTYYIEDNCKVKATILDNIVDILLYKGALIQGAPSSPAISNIIFRPIDIRIQKYCSKCGVDYSRYADDLLFSCHRNIIHHSRFICGIKRILTSNGFCLNLKKIVKAQKEISLGGYVVSTDIRLSRNKIKTITRLLYILEHFKEDDYTDFIKNLNDKIQQNKGTQKFNNKFQLVNHLAGYRSFFISAIKYSKNEKYKLQLHKKIETVSSFV